MIDNSHGSNGPYNTFLRNRAEKWGIFFSDTNSPGQNILGNEVTNTQFPYSLVNYRILGNDHYVYGNLVRGNTQPPGTGDIADSSFAYRTMPLFVKLKNWVSYGLPRTTIDGEIPAGIRWDVGTDLAYCFDDTQTKDTIPNSLKWLEEDEIILYPNPAVNKIHVMSSREITSYKLISLEGKVLSQEFFDPTLRFEVILPGDYAVYFLQVYFRDGGGQTVKVLKYGR